MQRTVGVKLVLVLLACSGGTIEKTCCAEDAQVLEQGAWRTRAVQTVGDLQQPTRAADVQLDQFGGLAGTKATATGFFRTEKIEGVWWLIDPVGHRFISIGMCSVNHGGVDAEALPTLFGTPSGWADATSKLMRSYGFNTLGCWSDWQAFRPTTARMPYTPRWNFMSTYKNRRPTENGARGSPHDTMPVFDPEFTVFCDEHARQLAALKDDPWLLGHFSDNELPFRPNPLTNFLALPSDDVGHRFARNWLEQRRQVQDRTDQQISDDDQTAFSQVVAERYYSVVAAAIRKYDPHHLYLGSRIHGRCLHEGTFRGAAAADVVSVNYYHRWSPEAERMAKWSEWSGRPLLVSEWYAQSLTTPDVAASGAGFRVRTGRDRGLFYQNMTLGLLSQPECVGWHWFKYGGDDSGCCKGIVDRQYQPHTDLLELMGELNRQAYALKNRAMFKQGE